ncbi:RluA family pseudouridine synthase [Oceanomicrobium pacificus]|uniref:Pseudouridine synthase n=1 Tax=Oceanomicrobium pacificus TaxID=2692916 RepID=A0A6B0TRC6_9RHOB|nr:RluA family pseudouridine synthase [Oceanomicrobium pacificus]MXU65249.1 RluA family pseudouridine synthase [Oceanomicrobium pacificus]
MSNSAPDATRVTITLPDGAGSRLDKALAAAAPEELSLSRSRVQALIAAGAVRDADGRVADSGKQAAPAGSVWTIDLPPAAPVDLVPQDIPLSVLYEDADLIVVDKPAGMVVHPAPGAPDGTLANALLYHCGDSLAGIGGEKRPGIVHRIDKDTSGILVAAKTDAAHQGLSAQFAAHSVLRQYLAVSWGAPSAGDARLRGLKGVSFEPGNVLKVDRPIARHASDRKKMAVTPAGGKRAVTRAQVQEVFGGGAAALLQCWLETGRTHQIRVHMAYAGHALLGDQTYGGRRRMPVRAFDGAVRSRIEAFPRQALHAATLGFTHPVSGTDMRFETAPPADFAALLQDLRGSATG